MVESNPAFEESKWIRDCHYGVKLKWDPLQCVGFPLVGTVCQGVQLQFLLQNLFNWKTIRIYSRLMIDYDICTFVRVDRRFKKMVSCSPRALAEKRQLRVVNMEQH
jgi:hypothetical protein